MGKKNRGKAEKKARDAAFDARSKEFSAASAAADNEDAVVAEAMERLKNVDVAKEGLPNFSARELNALGPRLGEIPGLGPALLRRPDMAALLQRMTRASQSNDAAALRDIDRELTAATGGASSGHSALVDEFRACLDGQDVLGLHKLFGRMAKRPDGDFHECVLEMVARLLARDDSPTWVSSLAAAGFERLLFATLKMPEEAPARRAGTLGVVNSDFYLYYCCHIARTVARRSWERGPAEVAKAAACLGPARKLAEAADLAQPSLCRRRCAPMRYKLRLAIPDLLRLASSGLILVRHEALNAVVPLLSHYPEHSAYDNRVLGGPQVEGAELPPLAVDALGDAWDGAAAIADALRAALSLLAVDAATWEAQLETLHGRHQADIISRGAWSAAGAVARGPDVVACVRRDAACRVSDLVAAATFLGDGARAAAGAALRAGGFADALARLAGDPAADATTLAFLGRAVHDMSHWAALAAALDTPNFVPSMFALLDAPRAALALGVADFVHHLRRATPFERDEMARGGDLGGCGPQDAGDCFERAVLAALLEVGPLEAAFRVSSDLRERRSDRNLASGGDDHALALDAPAPWLEPVWDPSTRRPLLGSRRPTDCGDASVEGFARHLLRSHRERGATTGEHAAKLLNQVAQICRAADAEPRGAATPADVAPLVGASRLAVDDFDAAGVDVRELWSGRRVAKSWSNDDLQRALDAGTIPFAGGNVNLSVVADETCAPAATYVYAEDGLQGEAETFCGSGVNGAPGRARAAAQVLAKHEADREGAGVPRGAVVVDVRLVGVEPRVWRRVAGVPANAPLSVLHDKILGPALGLERASHAYLFEPWAPRRLKGSSLAGRPRVAYGAPDVATADALFLEAECPDAFFADCVVVDATRVLLSDVLPGRGGEARLKYWYDLGERFLYELSVVADPPPAEAARATPAVVGGARFCPPENMGLPTYCRVSRIIAKGPARVEFSTAGPGGFWENTFAFVALSANGSLACAAPGPNREDNWSPADAQARLDAVARSNVKSLAGRCDVAIDADGAFGAAAPPLGSREGPRCAACGGRPKAGAKLSRCARCKNVSYCSAECQRGHWPKHKAACVQVAR